MGRSRIVGIAVAAVLAMAVLAGVGTYASTYLGGEPADAAATSPAEPAAQPTTPTVDPPAPTPTAAPTLTPAAVPPPAATPTTATATPKRTPAVKPAAKPAAKPVPKPMLARGSSGRMVRELQARLTQIGWFDADPSGFYGRVTETSVAGFQRKRGLPDTGALDRVTWRRLELMTREPSRDELYARPKPPAAEGTSGVRLDSRCLTGRVLCIDKTTRRLRWVVDGQIVSSMAVRFGSQFTPTREGTFSVYWKNRDHVSRLYDTAMPFAMFFSGGQAVHYSADFAARGYNGASHGCVNVRDWGKISALFDSVRTGDKVVVYRA